MNKRSQDDGLSESESEGGSRTRLISRGRRIEEETDDEETETDEDETRDDEGEEEEEVLFYTAQTREEAEALRQEEEREELWRELERLENMCLVLGIDFTKKLQEMGATTVEEFQTHDLPRVYRQLTFLQGTINTNYSKLQTTGKELLKEWELSNVPMKKMIDFAHVISVSDSISSSDVTDANFLSTLWLKRAQDELKRLQKDREKEEKKEYQQQKKILKELVVENHITWAAVDYDMKKKVLPANFPQETWEIRKCIEKAKELSLGRKEMVYRVELVRHLIEQKTLDARIIRGHFTLAKAHVEKMTTELPLKYDGLDVNEVLEIIETKIDALENKQSKEERERMRMLRVRTRYGSSPPPDSPAA